MSVELFDYRIADEPVGELVDRITTEVSEGRGRLRLFAMNPAKVEFAARDPELHRALVRAEILYPDGYGICWAHRILTGRRLRRVPGVDLSTRLLGRAAGEGWPVYMLGAREEVNRNAAREVEERWSGLTVTGRHHGYFGPDEEDEILERIRAASPTLLLVALGSPRQEIWIDRHFHEMEARVLMGLGGTFDVLAGAVPRAPTLFRETGLEWLYRILSQPDRIGRFFRTHPPFIFRTFRRALTRIRR